MIESTRSFNTPSNEQLHAAFLTLLLPRVERHGQVAFRHVRCPHRREECIAEMVALCWLWFVRLHRQGKDATTFVSALAAYAARHVRSGRRLCGQEHPKDVLSTTAQRRRGFSVGKLPDFETLCGNALSDALRDNTVTPPDEQAMFRIDFPCWLNTLSERDRRVVEDLMRGERTLETARKHGLSPGRVSQLRREFMQGWQRFCGDAEEGKATA